MFALTIAQLLMNHDPKCSGKAVSLLWDKHWLFHMLQGKCKYLQVHICLLPGMQRRLEKIFQFNLSIKAINSLCPLWVKSVLIAPSCFIINSSHTSSFTHPSVPLCLSINNWRLSVILFSVVINSHYRTTLSHISVGRM